MFINSLKPITLIGVSVRTLYAKVNWSKIVQKDIEIITGSIIIIHVVSLQMDVIYLTCY